MEERKAEIGVGLIGAGRMGSIRAHLASQNPAVNFLAIADVDPSKASALAEKTNASLHSADPGAVIHHPQVDVVIVSTPEGEHTDAICEALSLGKDVLVEKPLALSLVDADRILETYAGIAAVRAHVAEDVAEERFEERNQEYLRLLLRIAAVRAFSMPVLWFSGLVAAGMSQGSSNAAAEVGS